MAVTIKQIAKRAGISHGTVSDILNNKWKERRISPDTRDRVITIAGQLQYQKNIVASSLARRETKVLGLIIPCVTVSFFPEIARAVEETARRNGYQVFLCHSEENIERENEEIKLLREHQVAGMIIAPSSGRTNKNMDVFLELKKQGVPFVFIDRYIKGLDCNFVGTDDRAGAYKAVTYLIKLGHKRIAYINGPMNVSTTQGRWQGYRDALRDNNIVFDPEIVTGDNWFEEDGYKAARQLLLLKKRPTAVFAVTDSCAFGAIQAIEEQGLKVPHDISVIGFADIKTTLPRVPLTTIRQLSHRIGVMAVELLFKEIEKRKGNIRDIKAKKIFFKPELIIRSSTGKNTALGTKNIPQKGKNRRFCLDKMF